MPIHLAPLSRRQFLGRALVAGASLALSPELFARGKSKDDNSWALLSDTHLAGDRTLVTRGTNMARNFQSVAREVLALPERPAGVLISGDCAYNHGEREDYGVLTSLLSDVRQGGIPVHIALGNHDNRERFREILREKGKRPLPDRQVSLLKTPRANWFILDSLETTNSTPGLLGHEQLDWLAKTLDSNARKPALVVLHHNMGIEGGNMGLKDTFPFLEVIRPRKQVKACIYGHTHAWSVGKDSSGIHFVNLPPVAYVFRDGEPSGWVHATLDKDAMRLELRCVEPTHKAHGQMVHLPWRA